MNKYRVHGVIGEGAYGVVLRCRHKETREIFAIKKFKDNEDSCTTRKIATRELNILRLLKHPNIIRLYDAFESRGKLYLVFEYMPKTLLQIIEEHPNGLNDYDIMNYVFQLCHALDWCHRNRIIHRDIKPENLLVSNNKVLKLCDFGFSRILVNSAAQVLTEYVATRWYRPPELLLGCKIYSFSVDMWALGCIMGELIDGQPLFPGDSEIDQLYMIEGTLGPLPAELKHLRMQSSAIPKITGRCDQIFESLQKRYIGSVPRKGLLFIQQCLELNPNKRISSEEATVHSYFEDIAEDYYSKFSLLTREKVNSSQADRIRCRSRAKLDSRRRARSPQNCDLSVGGTCASYYTDLNWIQSKCSESNEVIGIDLTRNTGAARNPDRNSFHRKGFYSDSHQCLREQEVSCSREKARQQNIDALREKKIKEYHKQKYELIQAKISRREVRQSKYPLPQCCGEDLLCYRCDKGGKNSSNIVNKGQLNCCVKTNLFSNGNRQERHGIFPCLATRRNNIK